MRTERAVRYVEFALWVLAVATAAIVVAFGAGVLIGGTLRAGKLALFVVGFLLFGLGAVAMQPDGPDLGGSVADVDDGSSRPSIDAFRGDRAEGSGDRGGVPGGRGDESGVEDDDGGDGEYRFEARLREVGPLADYDLPPEDRVSRGVKVFTTSLVVLGVSFLLEVAGVQV